MLKKFQPTCTRMKLQALNHKLVFKKVNDLIISSPKARLWAYIKSRAKKIEKNDFDKDFFSWRIMQCLGKLWKKWENIEISSLQQTTNDAKMNNLLSEPRYHTEIFVINIY